MNKEINLLKVHEGYSKHMYKCTEGYNTIGYGLNLDAGIDPELAEVILQWQFSKVKEQCSKVFYWFDGLDEVRKHVVANMIFNMGLTTFKKFYNTRKHIRQGEWDLAAKEMLDSKWARQVKGRAVKLSEMMRTGKWTFE